MRLLLSWFRHQETAGTWACRELPCLARLQKSILLTLPALSGGDKARGDKSRLHLNEQSSELSGSSLATGRNRCLILSRPVKRRLAIPTADSTKLERTISQTSNTGYDGEDGA